MANKATTTARHRQKPLIGLLQQVVGELAIVIIRPETSGKQTEIVELIPIQRCEPLVYTLVFVQTTSVSLNSQDFFRFFSRILEIGGAPFAKQAHANTFALLDSPDPDATDEFHLAGASGFCGVASGSA